MGLQADTWPLRRREAPDPEAMCGLESVSWRLRDAGVVMSMAKARAALLQIAHPKIAAGLVEHSTFETDPYKRVRITGQTMTTILFGSPAERQEAARLLRGLHAAVRGTLPDGARYSAMDPELQWFVLATLIDSDLLVEELYVRDFDDKDRDAYYEESKGLFDAFQIPRRLVPETRTGLRDYLVDSYGELAIGPDARRLATKIFEPTFLRVARGPLLWGYRHALADLLPAVVKAGYGLDARPTGAAFVISGAKLLLPRLPSRLRHARLEPRAST